MMQLEWTGAIRDASKQRHVITMEFLQPYKSVGGAECAQYMSCLACMTDTACGWCDGRCVDRLSDVLATCATFLVNAQYCPVCADHITCSSCLQARLVITQRRRVAKSVGCFQQCLCVCLFVCQHDNFRTSKRRMMTLGVGALYKNLVQVHIWGS